MYVPKWVIFIVISIIIFSCLSYENKNEDNGVNIIDSFY